MGTSNFHNVNASRIFAVEIEDEFDYEIAKENLTDRLKELQLANFIKKSKGTYVGYDHGQGKDSTELRSFNSTVIGTLGAQHEYRDFILEVNLIIVIRSGYYSGCNLDFDINIKLDGEECDEEYFAETIEYNCNYSPSKAQKYATLASKKVDRFKSALVEALESVFTNVSTPLHVVAQFSNGETIYTRETQTNGEAINEYISE